MGGTYHMVLVLMASVSMTQLRSAHEDQKPVLSAPSVAGCWSIPCPGATVTLTAKSEVFLVSAAS